MEEKIKARIKELERAEQQAIGQVNAVRGALAELRALLLPDEPTLTGDPLDTREEATNGYRSN